MREIEIKKLLVRHFLQRYENFVIGSEFPFQFGERRADLAVFVSDHLTAFEIKGSGDNVHRLGYQIDSYKKFFDFCFVVCEPNNLAKIQLSIPKNIGILLVENDEIVTIRQSKQFFKHDKKVLCSVLSVQKLITLTAGQKIRSKNDLCDYVSKHNTLEFLRKLSRDDFIEKYSVGSRLLKQETTLHLNSDDIYTITKKAPSILKKRASQ